MTTPEHGDDKERAAWEASLPRGKTINPDMAFAAGYERGRAPLLADLALAVEALGEARKGIHPQFVLNTIIDNTLSRLSAYSGKTEKVKP